MAEASERRKSFCLRYQQSDFQIIKKSTTSLPSLCLRKQNTVYQQDRRFSGSKTAKTKKQGEINTVGQAKRGSREEAQSAKRRCPSSVGSVAYRFCPILISTSFSKKQQEKWKIYRKFRTFVAGNRSSVKPICFPHFKLSEKLLTIYRI